MIFYSDQIINDTIYIEPIDNILESIEYFRISYVYYILKHSIRSISHLYTTNILDDTTNVIAFYCMDTQFSIENCPSVVIYRKCNHVNEIVYYILLACTKNSFRGNGYASILLHGLQKRIHAENLYTKKTVKLVTSSVEKSIDFYEKNGFVLTGESISEYPELMKYEKYEDGKKSYVMECTMNNNISRL